MLEELWEDIIGYNGKYRVSNYGMVLSLQYPNKPKLLSTNRLTKDGYPRVALRIDGVQTEFRIHRLVQAHFISNPNELPEVNHIDGNKENNMYTNLEWCTHQRNMAHASETQLFKSVKKENNPNYKGRIVVLRGEEVVACLCGLQEIKDFNLAPSKVYSCLSGARKTHKGFTFKREEL